MLLGVPGGPAPLVVHLVGQVQRKLAAGQHTKHTSGQKKAACSIASGRLLLLLPWQSENISKNMQDVCP